MIAYCKKYIHVCIYMATVRTVMPAAAALSEMGERSIHMDLFLCIALCIYLLCSPMDLFFYGPLHLIYIYIYIYIHYKDSYIWICLFHSPLPRRHIYLCIYSVLSPWKCYYGVATISRLLKIICLFCKRAL